MSKSVQQFLLWAPRGAAILFILFLSMFALDIFDMNLGFWGTIVGLFMHLIPSIILAIAVALAWRWEWIGAVLFIGWAIFYVSSTRGFPLSVFVLIAGIPFVIGVLFLAGWIYRKQIRSG